MPRHIPQPVSRTRQIREHNRKAMAENRPEDVLPEESATRVWEPHEWNAEIAKRAKARGEVPNIAQPKLGRGFVSTTEEPVKRDLNKEAQERAIGIKTGKKPFPKGVRTEKPPAGE